MKTVSLLVCLFALGALMHHAAAVVTCETFESLALNSVYSNTTGYTPGTSITSNAYLQLFRNKDPSVLQYNQLLIVPSFAAFGTSGNAAQLDHIDIQFSFRGSQIKYISFDFYDTGNVQNLRVNKDLLYKGSLVTMGGVVSNNVAFKPRSTRRFQRNVGEIFAVNNQHITDFWIGGDDLTIDNVCWDTAYHEPPIIPVASQFLSRNTASALTLPVTLLAVASLVAMVFAF